MKKENIRAYIIINSVKWLSVLSVIDPSGLISY